MTLAQFHKKMENLMHWECFLSSTITFYKSMPVITYAYATEWVMHKKNENKNQGHKTISLTA